MALVGALMLVLAGGAAGLGSDYIASAPETVYTSGPMSPQNMDFDAANNMFKAHSGWLNDKLVHYYKFRMYTPDTYPTKVTMGSAPDIPVAPLFLLTTDGDFSGLVPGQDPILRYHTADGEDYSDFVEVNFVTVASNYTADTLKSYGDIVDAGLTPDPTGIYVNLPVVPTGSTLEDPAAPGTAAPITGLMAWYKGVAVQTFAFETTDQGFADTFNPLTRTGTAGQADSGYEIVVSPFVGATSDVSIAPIWHINQYSTGVETGVNHGGPSDMGQRNVINVDRKEAAYSPLWQVLWISKVPIGYSADMASNSLQFTTANGFEVMATPMYVNCPNIGPHGGGALNPEKADSFGAGTFDPSATVAVEGALVMEAGKTVKAYVGAAEVASAVSGMMGGYTLEIDAADLEAGDNVVEVKDAAMTVLQTVTVSVAEPPKTVYESMEMSPQNMDYDGANKMFKAHSGWLNDQLIHYYKFRMYTPDTYPTKVQMGQSPTIPVAPVYLLTTTGDLTGLVADQLPILRYHTADGEAYSDFVRVVFVTVGSSYVANTWTAYADLVDAGASMTESSTFVNMPVVPTGSKLEDPASMGTAAPISAVMAWYRGWQVQTFVFETTSQAFADAYNPLTRTGTAGSANSGFEIVVTPFVQGSSVTFAPIWHLNQYSTGVTTGTNHGGPSDMGQRNVIDKDRMDLGYSPLWQVHWVAKVPVGYSADMASHAAQITGANGFEVMVTPMFVNCPNVGPHGGGAENTDKASSFGAGSLEAGSTVKVEGALVMEAGKTVKAFVGTNEVASATTGMMGGYVLEVRADDLAVGDNTVEVKDGAGNVLQTVTLSRAAAAPPPGFLPGLDAGLVAVALAGAAFVAIASRMRRTR